MTRSESLRRNLPLKEMALICGALWFSLYYLPLFGEYVESARSDREIPPETEEWRAIEGAYFTVYYKPDTDLRPIERKLRRSGFFFGSSSDTLSSAEEKISSRIDRLFRKTEEALDMYPSGIHLTVRIFRSQSELNDEYYRIFKDLAEDSPAFYIHKYKTIYTTAEGISDSVIVHEMSHAIVDHYFGVLPPEKIREIISSYVETHLEEEGVD